MNVFEPVDFSYIKETIFVYISAKIICKNFHVCLLN